MMRKVMVIVAIMAILAASGARAAPQQCGQRQAVVAGLAERYGETRHGAGLAANNVMMELYASDATGIWTITITMPTGVMCLVASGVAFDGSVAPLPPKGDPA